MSNLTPAQRLRVAAALTGVTHKVELSREDALRLARAWEKADEALRTLDADRKDIEARLNNMIAWGFRVVVFMGIAQGFAAWVLS
jgi:uncharacterized protein YciW